MARTRSTAAGVQLPLRGLHLGSSEERQPPNTSPDLLNVRLRQHRGGEARDRLCSRPGSSLYCPVAAGVGNVKSIASVPSDSASFTVGATIYCDPFYAAADTSPGDLGDQNNDGVADWKVHRGTRQAINQAPGSAETWPFVQRVLSPTSPFTGPALDTDGTTLVIGVPDEGGSPIEQRGRVHVYRRVEDKWTTEQTLTPPTSHPEAGQPSEFGFAVAVSGDRLLVGAPNMRPPSSLNRLGMVYVYERTGSGGTPWQLAASIDPHAGGSQFLSPLPRFGGVLALDGTRMVAGCPLAQSSTATGQPNSGVALIWHRVSMAVWSVVFNSGIPPNDSAGGEFGASVAIDGNYVVIGQPSANLTATNSGRAYVYFWGGASYALQATLAAAAPATNGDFGRSVAIDGDATNDYIAVGEPGDAAGGTGRGEIHVFHRSGTTWPEELMGATPLRHTGSADQDRLGARVGVSLSPLRVFGLTSRNPTGSLYVFQESATVWSQLTSTATPAGFTSMQGVFGATFSADWVFASCLTTAIPSNMATLGFGRQAATADGPYINVLAGNTPPAVVDDKAYPSGTITVWGAMLDRSYGTLEDTFVLELEFKTAATLTGVQGVVGFMLNAQETALDAHDGSDRATLVGLAMESDGVGVKRWCTINNVGPVLFSTSNGALTWQAGQIYTLQLRVQGTYGELWLDDGAQPLLLMTIANLRKPDGQGSIAAADRRVGFVFGSAGLGAGTFLEHVDTFCIKRATSARTAGRALVAVVGPDIVQVTRSGVSTLSNGVNRYPDSPRVIAVIGPQSSATTTPAVYLVDGKQYLKVQAGSLVVETWTPTTGDLPQGNDPTQKCPFAVVHQQSIYLRGPADFPNNIYRSKKGDFDDWNLTPIDPDGTEAATLDTSKARLPAKPISCLAPFDADNMLVAAFDQAWLLQGNLADQVFLDDLSPDIGVCGPLAWCRDEIGNLYTVGFQGFYRWVVGRKYPEPVSRGRVDRFFRSIDFAAVDVICQFDRREQVISIHAVPTDPARPVATIVYDPVKDAWLPESRPAAHGPFSLGVAVSLNGREDVILGGRDGYIRVHDEDADTDAELVAGQLINSYAVLAPMLGAGRRQVMLDCLEGVTAPNSEAVRVTVRSGDSAAQALAADAQHDLVWEGGGRTANDPVETNGAAIVVRLEAATPGDRWGIDTISASVRDGGPVQAGA